MVLFTSTSTVILYTVMMTALLLFVFLRTNPLHPASAFVRHLWTSRAYALHFIALLLVLIMNKYELKIEQAMSLTVNFTEFVAALEGDIVLWIQQTFEHEWLTPLLVFFYVIVLQAILIVSVALYTYRRQFQLYYAFCYAIILNYLIAIPFYLFVPVQEVWSFEPSGVRFLMLASYPTFEETYRNLSGLDNCFPSLHTSLSVTMALLARRSGLRSWAWFTGISAVIIIFSIFYLGIHWVTDMIGGLLLGILAASVGMRLGERTRFTSSGAYTPQLQQK